MRTHEEWQGSGRGLGEFREKWGSIDFMETKLEVSEMEIDESDGLVRYCAVDPGVVTGFVVVDLPTSWASFDLYGLLSGLRGGKFCREMELRGAESGQVDAIENMVSGSSISAKSVIIEDFILRLRTQDRALLAPVRVAARLDDRLYKGGFKGQIRYQSPSDAKSIVTDLRLKEWGLWHVGSPHIRDAWRHMVKFLREERMRSIRESN